MTAVSERTYFITLLTFMSDCSRHAFQKWSRLYLPIALDIKHMSIETTARINNFQFDDFGLSITVSLYWNLSFVWGTETVGDQLPRTAASSYNTSQLLCSKQTFCVQRKYICVHLAMRASLWPLVFPLVLHTFRISYTVLSYTVYEITNIHVLA